MEAVFHLHSRGLLSKGCPQCGQNRKSPDGHVCPQYGHRKGLLSLPWLADELSVIESGWATLLFKGRSSTLPAKLTTEFEHKVLDNSIKKSTVSKKLKDDEENVSLITQAFTWGKMAISLLRFSSSCSPLSVLLTAVQEELELSAADFSWSAMSTSTTVLVFSPHSLYNSCKVVKGMSGNKSSSRVTDINSDGILWLWLIVWALFCFFAGAGAFKLRKKIKLLRECQ